jgi:hypothetical protein
MGNICMKKPTFTPSPVYVAMLNGLNERKRDTRRKILIGSYYLKKAREENTVEELKAEMLRFLKREIDRDLFEDGLKKVTLH